MKFIFSILLLTLSSSLHTQELKKNQILSAKVFSEVTYIFCKSEDCPTKVEIDSKQVNFDKHSLSPFDLNIFELRSKMEIAEKPTVQGQYGVIVKEDEQETFKFILQTQAEIELCDKENPKLLGCADKITIDGNTSNADFTKVNIAKENFKEKSAFVVGHFTSEDGHMPDPTQVQHIFKVASIVYDTQKIQEGINNSKREIAKVIEKETTQSTSTAPSSQKR